MNTTPYTIKNSVVDFFSYVAGFVTYPFAWVYSKLFNANHMAIVQLPDSSQLSDNLKHAISTLAQGLVQYERTTPNAHIEKIYYNPAAIEIVKLSVVVAMNIPTLQSSVSVNCIKDVLETLYDLTDNYLLGEKFSLVIQIAQQQKEPYQLHVKTWLENFLYVYKDQQYNTEPFSNAFPDVLKSNNMGNDYHDLYSHLGITPGQWLGYE